MSGRRALCSRHVVRHIGSAARQNEQRNARGGVSIADKALACQTLPCQRATLPRCFFTGFLHVCMYLAKGSFLKAWMQFVWYLLDFSNLHFRNFQGKLGTNLHLGTIITLC